MPNRTTFAPAPGTGRCCQADQRLVGRGPQRGAGQLAGGPDQGGDLVVGVKVGNGAPGAVPDQPRGWDLMGGVEGVQVDGEAADHRQPGGLMALM